MRRSPQDAGFTLIELLVVILLISILAATAASRFFTTDEIQPQQQRDAVINLLRQVQMQSMQDSSGVYSRCPTLLLQSTVAGIARQNACNASASFTVDSSDLSQIDLTGSTGFRVTVSCDSRSYTEGETAPGVARSVRIYTLDAVACSGTGTCPDNAAAAGANYVERRRQVQASD